jgi:hypothetical protein
MQTTTYYFKRLFPLLMIAVLVMSCSAYRFHRLNINGKEEHLFRAGGCRLFMRANQVETLGKVNLQFQIWKGTKVHIGALRLSLDDEPVPVAKVNVRYAGKQQQGDFDAFKNGTLTLTLEKSTIAGRSHLELLPSAFVTCKGHNLLNQPVRITLKDLE